MAFSSAKFVFNFWPQSSFLHSASCCLEEETVPQQQRTQKRRERGAKDRHEDTAKTISTRLDEDLTKMTTTNLIILVAHYSGETS